MNKKYIQMQLFLLLQLTLHSVFITEAFSQSIRSFKLPVVIDYDGIRETTSPVCLDVCLSFQAKEYHISLAEFRSLKTDEAESFLQEVLNEVERQNIKACLALSHSESVKPLENEYKGMETAVKMFNEIIKEPDTLTLFYQVYFENKRMFMFGRQNTRHFFYVLLSQTEDERFFWDTKSNTPVLGSILSSLTNLSNLEKQEIDWNTKSYMYTLPLTNPDFDYVIRLEFNGRKYETEGYLENKDNLDKAASLLMLRYIASFTGNTSSLITFFTEGSQARFRKSLEKKKQIDSWQQPPRVHFVLDSHPLYTIFYEKKHLGKTWIHSQDTFYLKENDSIKLTNFQHYGFYQQMLLSEPFLSQFAKEVLHVTEEIKGGMD